MGKTSPKWITSSPEESFTFDPYSPVSMSRFTCQVGFDDSSDEERQMIRVSRAKRRGKGKHVNGRLKKTEAEEEEEEEAKQENDLPERAPHCKAVQAFGGDGMKAFHMSMELFLLDPNMRVLRYTVVDKVQKKLLSNLAKTVYKTTTKCSGSGPMHVLDFTKTKSTLAPPTVPRARYGPTALPPFEAAYLDMLVSESGRFFPTVAEDYHNEISVEWPTLSLENTLFSRFKVANAYLKRYKAAKTMCKVKKQVILQLA
eukprot:TRINITY_DN37760_c0_g1_i1.p1 TRINITY_DN37760_c0_g1~~TRINITY_DN37760_c0_g1_i1.p1  ORF type:complete len:257 (+),score=40.10 TRINITY_DN37760_c0_g1_i1:57-827(+)